MPVLVPFTIDGDRRAVVVAGTLADGNVPSMLAVCGQTFDPALFDPTVVSCGYATFDPTGVTETDAVPTDPRSISDLLSDLVVFTEEQDFLWDVETAWMLDPNFDFATI